MANFTPSAKTAQDFNNGVEYIDGDADAGILGDAVKAESINSVIEGLLYTQGLAVNQPDFSEADNVGTPEVSVIAAQDGSARLKFKNLKGQTGETGATGLTGATGATGNGISSAVTAYAVSTSGTTPPSNEDWQSTIPKVAQGSYLWTRTIDTYTNGMTNTSYSVARQGVDGEGFNSQGSYPNASVGKLSTARAIDGISFDGTASITHYGVCSTVSGTTEKTVACTGFVLTTGARITVNFSTANTVSQPTLNVNTTGAKGIRCKGRSTGIVWKAEIMTLVYDGTYWQIVNGYSLAEKPVNSHHIQYDGESTPATLFGGTWAVDTEYIGRVIVGSGTNYTLGATGGEETHTHSENLRARLSIEGGVAYLGTEEGFGIGADKAITGLSISSGTWATGTSLGIDGDINSSSNMPPYKVVAVWKRTA